MRELGYVYGEHFITEARGSEGKQERMPIIAAELVAAKVDVIVATGAAISALRQATPTIPIVMAANSDPVGQGLVQILAHPGGNVTGLSLQTVETTGKRLELIREVVPGRFANCGCVERADIRQLASSARFSRSAEMEVGVA